MPPHKLPLGIAYDDSGSGIPTVFVHGFPLDRGVWRPQVSGLGQLCRCIVPDLRGFGDSLVEGPFTMDRYADDIAELLDSCSVRRAVIAGCSMGGYVAFAFWRRHRERVLGLALCDTRAGADSEQGMEKRRAMIQAARNGGSAAVAALMIDSLLAPGTRERCPEVEAAVRLVMAEAPIDGVVGAIEAMLQRPDSTPTLPTIDVPTVVITGEEDAIVPVSEARGMSDAIRGSVFEVIPGAGHLSNLERPAAFNTIFGEFLTRVRAH
jgi:pimeloyl-ACP methyl ester carboxylesterase